MNHVQVVLLLLSAVFASPAQQPASAGEITDNPQRFVLNHAEGDNAGIAQFDCSNCSAMNDLLFVAARFECVKNYGCQYYVFRKIDSKSYKFITIVYLHRLGFQFLKTKHHGFNDILVYYRSNMEEGELTHLEFDGKDYKEGESHTIKSSEFESRIKLENTIEIYLTKDLERVQP